MSLNKSQLHQDKVKTESQSYQKKNPNVQSLEIELNDDAVAYYRSQGYLVEYVDGGNIPPEQEAYQKKMKEGEPNMVHRNANWAAKIRSGLPVEYANYNDEQIRELYDKQNIVGAERYGDEMIPSYNFEKDVEIYSSGVEKKYPYWNQLPEHTKKTILDANKPTPPEIIAEYGYDPWSAKNNPMLRSALSTAEHGDGLINVNTGTRNKSYAEGVTDDIVKPGMALAAVPLAMAAAPTVMSALNTNLISGIGGTSALDAAGLYGGYQGAKALPGDVSEFANDPGWSGAGKIGLDALGIAGGAYSTGKLLKNLPGAQFLGKTTAGSVGSGNLNSGFNPEKVVKYTNRTNKVATEALDEFGQTRNFNQNFSELPHYPVGTNPEEILSLVGQRANELDEFAKANPNWMPTKESFKYLGTNSERPFIQMNTPVGNQTFYRSSGLGKKAGTQGNWVPFEGTSPIPNQSKWFMKQGSRGNYQGQPMDTKFRFNNAGEQESVDLATQLKEQGIDGIEALRSGKLKLDFPGYDFNYTANPESMIHSIANSGMLDDAYNTATAFKQYGGSTEPEYTYLELDDDAAKQYRDGGWVVEEIPEYEEGGNIISPGDGWEYKQEGDAYFTKKEGATDWIDTTGNTKAREAIKSKIYKEPTIVNNTIIDPTVSNNIATGNTVPNPSIIDIQTKLVDAGYNIGHYGDGTPLIDGDFGTKTQAALADYNKGIAPKTPTKLNKVNNSSNELYEKSPLTKVSELDNLKDGFLPIITNYGDESCSKQGKCSYNTSKKMGTVLKGSIDDLGKLWAEDAWFNKDRQLKDEGSLIYNTEERDYLKMTSVPKEFYSKLQVGDYVHLNRPNTTSSYKYEKAVNKNDPTLKNEKIEHMGFIIGKDEDGTPLLWHGSESGNAYVQRLDGVLALETENLEYKISSIVRNPNMKNLNEEAKQIIQNNSYYKPYDDNIKLVPTKNSTDAQREGFETANYYMKYFKEIGYDQKDVAMVGQLLVGGIMQNESSGDESDYRTWVKQPAAYLSKDMAGVKKAFEGDQASWGVYQMKPNYNFKEGKYLTKYEYDDQGKKIKGSAYEVSNPRYGQLNDLGKKLQDVGIEVDEIFNDVSNQTLAGMLILLENYNKLKKDEKFDAETGLYNGNLPASYILAKSWQAGSGWQNRDKYQKWLDAADVTYSENALNNAANTSKIEGVDQDLQYDSAISLNAKYADTTSKLAELYNTEEVFDPNVKIDLQTQYNQPTAESSNINLPGFKQYSQVNLPSIVTPNLHRRNYREDGGESNSAMDYLKGYVLGNK